MSYLYENYIYPNKLTNRMKITLIRAEKESGKEALSTLETDALIKKLKTETKAGHVSTLRAILPQLEGTCAQYEHIDKLPRIYPAVEYSRTQEGERRMKNYNGLVQLEINRLSGITEAEYVKQQAALLPQTFAAFCGSSGRSAKIWVLFALPDGTTPKRESDATLFHAHAYRMAVKCYQPLLPFAITLKEPSLTQSCRMTLDDIHTTILPLCLSAWNSPSACPRKRTSGNENSQKRTRCCGCIRTVKPRTPLPYSSSRPLAVHSADWAAGNGTGIYGYCWYLWPNIVSRQAFPKRK